MNEETYFLENTSLWGLKLFENHCKVRRVTCHLYFQICFRSKWISKPSKILSTVSKVSDTKLSVHQICIHAGDLNSDSSVPATDWLYYRLAVTLFARIFTGEGTAGYMGCNFTEHRGQRLERRPLVGILPSSGEGEGQVFMFCTLKA